MRLSKTAMESSQLPHDYSKVWQGLKKQFKGRRR
jgi:hypothetical protein